MMLPHRRAGSNSDSCNLICVAREVGWIQEVPGIKESWRIAGKGAAAVRRSGSNRLGNNAGRFLSERRMQPEEMSWQVSTTG